MFFHEVPMKSMGTQRTTELTAARDFQASSARPSTAKQFSSRASIKFYSSSRSSSKKPSKRSEPATTYAHALNPRFRRPTAQGCQSLSRGVAL